MVRLAGDVAHLAPDALLPLGRTGDQIERPGERLGRRLVAGGEEGDEIVDELLVRHRLAGVGIAGGGEPRQQIVASMPAAPPPRQDRAQPRRADALPAPAPARTCPDTRPTAETAAWPAAMSQEMVESALSEALRMAAASASALPANMVAEMTRNVVSVMSRSIGLDGPGRCVAPTLQLVARRRRSWPARDWRGRPGGTAARRCAAASASSAPAR